MRGEREIFKEGGMHTVSGCMLVNLGHTIYCNMHLILGHIISAYQGIFLVEGLSLYTMYSLNHKRTLTVIYAKPMVNLF